MATVRDVSERLTTTTMWPNAIEVREIPKAFGKVEALRDVSLDVPAGTIHGLLGPNGARQDDAGAHSHPAAQA